MSDALSPPNALNSALFHVKQFRARVSGPRECAARHNETSVPERDKPRQRDLTRPGLR